MPPINLVIQRSPVIVDPPLPSDPALRAIVDDVLANLRYSLANVAAEEQPVVSGSMDVMFRNLLTARSAPTQARVREKARSMLDAPPPVRTAHFGRYSTVSAQEYRTIGSDGLASRVGQLPLTHATLMEGVKKYFSDFARLVNAIPPSAPVQEEANDAPGGHMHFHMDPDLMAGLAFKKMRLFIREVRCKVETDEIGSDEINLGGTATNPFGKTQLINQFEVSQDFDQGEKVTFGMSKVFASWNLETKPVGFPYVYGAIIAMAEKDDGGFYQFLKDLWAQVEAAIKSAVAGLVGAAIGGALGSTFGPLGAVVGAITGALVGYFIGWVIELFDNADDIVATKTLLMTLGSPKKSYYDWAKLTTATGWTKTLNFKGDGGRYEVDIAYKIFTQ